MSKQPFGVLVIHGFGSSLDCVNGLEPPIRALGLPIIVPVLRGHNAESPEALRGVTWHDWVDDAEEAFQRLCSDVERVIIVGHSMGGLVTLHLAAENHERIDSIVLAATAVQIVSPFAPGRPFNFLAPLVARLIKNWNTPPVYADPSLTQYDTNYPWVPTDAALSLLEFTVNTRDILGQVDVPTLIMQSRKDSTVAPESAEIIYNGISTPQEHKRISWFERTEHEMFRDCESEATIQTVVDFVQEKAFGIGTVESS